MVQLFCKLCFQSINCLNWKTHITQKEHLQQLPVKIVIKGAFQKDRIKDIFSYFAKFGGIRSQNVIDTNNQNELVIEYRFWDARVYSEIIHSEHEILGQEVEVSWYKKTKSGPVEYVIQDERMLNEKIIYRKLAVINATKVGPTFREQLSVFLDQLKSIRKQLEKIRQTIHSDLTTVLATSFPQNQLHFFGSTITDLDLFDSDLNIYLDGTDSLVTTLELIRETLTRSGCFENVSVILKNETPTLRFRHKTSKFCELSIKNELPVGTSELIKFYLSLNEKLRVLMLLVKFWADCHELRGEKGFSSYAINLMVIFYLQQPPYGLPSVYDLQKDTLRDEVDGWDCAFGPVEFSDSPLENITVLELLRGFFQFYGNFDYGYWIISIYTGRAINKCRFIKPLELPECFQNYLNQDREFPVNAGICIQDPFDHSRNVSFSSSLSSSGKLAAVCRYALSLSGEKELLSRLLSVCQIDGFTLKMIPTYSEREWKLIFKRLIFKILKDLCGCEVKESVYNITVLVYHCRGGLNFWDNRVEVAKHTNRGSTSGVDHEAAITEILAKNPNQSMIWEIEVSLRFEEVGAIVQFKENEFSLVPHVQHFVYLRLREFLTDRASVAKMRNRRENPVVVSMDAEEIPADLKPERKYEELNSISGKQTEQHFNLETVDIIEDQTQQSSFKSEGDSLSATDPLKTMLSINDESEESMDLSFVKVESENWGGNENMEMGAAGGSQIETAFSGDNWGGAFTNGFSKNFVKTEIQVENCGTSAYFGTAGTSQVDTSGGGVNNWSDISPVTPLSRLPAKSQKHYEVAYNQFKTWCGTNNNGKCTESVLLEYFSEKSLHRKSSTMWAHYSMLKASLAVRENLDISSFTKLTDFLKRNSVGYRPKSSKSFTRRDIERFLIGAPDKTYLLMKVALIMGIAGGCRRDELAMMSIDDIEDTGSVLIVRVPKTSDAERTFTIVGRTELNMLEIYRKYAALRMPHTEHRRFFVNYQQGKCSIQPVGVHTFGRIPSLIAKYLQLEEPSSYTGHCFRKSSATLRADAGIDIMSDISKRRKGHL